MSYGDFLLLVKVEFRRFKEETRLDSPTPFEFQEAFVAKLNSALVDYSNLLFYKLFWNDEIARVKPTLYFGHQQINFLKNQLRDFQTELVNHCSTFEEVEGEHFYQRKIFFRKLSSEMEERIALIERQRVIDDYHFMKRIVEPVLASFTHHVLLLFSDIDNLAKSIIPSLNQEDNLGEEVLHKMMLAFLSYSEDELEFITRSTIDRVSLENPIKDKIKPLNGWQAGILLGFLRRNDFITSKNDKEIGVKINQLTGTSWQNIRTALGIMNKKKRERVAFLQEFKEGEDNHDARQVIKFLNQVILDIKAEIGE